MFSRSGATRAALYAMIPAFAACSDAPTSTSRAGDVADLHPNAAVRVCTGRCEYPIVFDAGTDPVVPVRHIYSVNPDGSGFTQLTTGQHSDNAPAWSPDYSKIVFTSNRHGGPHNVYIMGSKGQNVKRLNNVALSESSPVISPDGKKIVFVRDWANGGQGVLWMDIDGTNEKTCGISGVNREPTWSPDGKKILFTSNMHSTYNALYDRDVYVIDLNCQGLTRLTNDPAYDANPVWSPDGSKIFFESDRGGQYGIYKMNPNGSNVELVTLAPVGSYVGYISLNAAGTKMLYYSDESGQQFRISGLNGGASSVLPLPKTLQSLGSASWSFAR
ncbi:MAG TPA: DPP IV N-terminal domain-containing protein [Gemmatimonadaceae bacterium]|nr:DPP IV N-terminal domain-containing protein [Gemmatimonadaceae bacterium]